MDLRTITQLILRLTGVYLLVVSLMALPPLFFVPSEVAAPSFVSIALYGLAALVLLRFSGPISDRVVPSASAPTAWPTSEGTLSVALVLLGVYFTVTATYDLVFTWGRARLFYSAMQPFPGSRGPDLAPNDFGRLLAGGVQLVLGLGLAFGNRAIARHFGNGSRDR